MEQKRKNGGFHQSKLKFCAAVLAIAFIFIASPFMGGLSAAAGNLEAQKLIPLGKTTGIKLFSQGAMIVGFSGIPENNSKSPAKEYGLAVGDVILTINQKKVDGNLGLSDILKQAKSPKLALEISRNGKKQVINITAFYDEAQKTHRIGAWVRDSLAGIGTITFINPQTGDFGALGHGICDADTGALMPFESGSLMPSSVSGVRKGESGNPGELNGTFELTAEQGVLYSNTTKGIFGKITDKSIYESKNAMPIAEKNEIKCGKAYIISNVENDKCEKYDIEIMQIYGDDDSMRDMMIKVCDERLIKITGGIVQGMSGSPIIQNGKIVGAVTHVLVNDPQRGYAISIERMLP